jgi:uncharacterized membrane protein
MLKIFRRFDWKVVIFALVSCYLLPALLFGSLTATTSLDSLPHEGSAMLLSMYGLAVYVGAPIAGGYFTARFAANRPKLHVLIVAVLGVLLACLSYRGPLLAVFAYSLVALVLATLGAFLRLRGLHKDEA